MPEVSLPESRASRVRSVAIRKLRDARIAVGSWPYIGRRFTDPICGHRFRRLLSTPSGARNAWCPRCWSAERHRVLWLYLERETPLLRDRLRVLHLAPERGLGARLRALPNLDYTSADLGAGRAMVTADLTALPFADGSFDVVLCNHVLEHIPEDRQAMREIRRVLSLDGWVVMQHPIDANRAETFEEPAARTPEQRKRLFFQSDHVRLYGRDFADRLAQADLVTETIRYVDRCTAEERARYRLDQAPSSRPDRDIEADVIYLCRPAQTGTPPTPGA
jgi:hypothetical protein